MGEFTQALDDLRSAALARSMANDAGALARQHRSLSPWFRNNLEGAERALDGGSRPTGE
jgi:hypothetical protein